MLLPLSRTPLMRPLAGGSTVQVLLAFFFSAIATVINQKVWQRALKVCLSGSDAISSMIVVLVFMPGLGLGAFWIDRSAHRIPNS